MLSPREKLSRKISIMVLLAAHALFKAVMMTIFSGVAALASNSFSNSSSDLGSLTSCTASWKSEITFADNVIAGTRTLLCLQKDITEI